MKKKAILILGVICGFTLSAQQQNQKAAEDRYAQDPEARKASRSTLVTVKNSKEKTAAPIWSEDFSGGIPSGWTNIGHAGDPSIPVANALWEYRGPSTIPNDTVGSRGAFSGAQAPITSPSATNGFVIFDSDFLDNNGIVGNDGNGVAPTPHVGDMTTDTIDFSGYPNIQLTIHSYARYFAGRQLVAFSSDGGVTWGDTVQLNTGIAVNASTGTDEVSVVNISNAVGNSQYAMMKFIYDGSFNEPGANGLGYYYWMIDDISVDILPNHAFKFTDAGGAPASDIIFGGDGGNAKTGHMNLNQVRSFEFDSNILNFGVEPQTNVVLNVDILNNGAVVQTLQSASVPILNPGDTGLFSSFFTPAYTPTSTGDYQAVLYVTSDSVGTVAGSVSPSDTAFTISVDDSTSSVDFSSFDNSIGTPQLGDDGAALATMLTFPNASDLTNNKVELAYVDVRFSTLTVDDGDMIVEVYDTAVDLINGFAGPALLSKAFTLNNVSGTLARFDVRNDVGSEKDPVRLDANKSYYLIVYLFSNGGNNLIRIANDRTVAQPGFSTLMYNADDARFYTGYAGGSRTFSSPWIRAITSDFENIGIDEYATFDLSVYPNPTNGERVSLTIDEGGAYSIELVNTIGKLVYQEDLVMNGNEVHNLNLSHLSNGVYILNVKGESGFKTTKLTIK
jgi:hypothetical protein